MPYQELKRLEAVNRFLQIQIDKTEEFKNITQLAAEICGVPQALITLIGEDTEYMFDEGAFTPSSGREESFCHYVVEGGAVMIVPDAQLDYRLKDYDAVTRPSGIRFYAGAPLVDNDGHTLGSLCVIDQKPGELTQIQKDMLQNLAMQVIQLLGLETNLYSLKQEYLIAKGLEMKMSLFFESKVSCHLLLNRDLEVICFNKAVDIFIKKVYGINMLPGMYVTEFVHSTYEKEFMENCRLALAGRHIRFERLISFPNYSVWFLLSYEPARNQAGEIIGISFNAIDISKRIAAQERAALQQHKLHRMAFMQSHEFRKPVSTIKGLLNLLEMDGYTTAYPQLKVMRDGVNELDERIVEIVNFTAPKG